MDLPAIVAAADSTLIVREATLGSQILIGIISGLVTSVITLVFVVLWQGTIVPWHEARVYTGIDIGGSWTLNEAARRGPEWSQKEVLELNQTAHHLAGSQVLTPKADDDGSPRSLAIVGKIRDRFVVLQFTSTDNRRIGYGALLAQVCGEGTRLDGAALYYDVNDQKIMSAPVTYTRE